MLDDGISSPYALLFEPSNTFLSAFWRGYPEDLLGFSLLQPCPQSGLGSESGILPILFSFLLPCLLSVRLFSSMPPLDVATALSCGTLNRSNLTLILARHGLSSLCIWMATSALSCLVESTQAFFLPFFSDVLQSKRSDAVSTVWIALLSCHLIQVAPVFMSFFRSMSYTIFRCKVSDSGTLQGHTSCFARKKEK